MWSVFCLLIQLGDRHLDNILMSLADGRILHIDFDCIFGKGKILPVPELVDFRLTLNILSSLGLSSCYGLFRTYFFETARAFQRNREHIMSTFKIFDIDPIREQLRSRKFNRVDLIKDRLDLLGQLKTKEDVNFLLDKNQSLSTLKEMFFGWCPHI